MGIEISPLLVKYINCPTLVNRANKETIARLATEVRPIYERYKCTLDGPNEIGHVLMFCLFLKSRTDRIPNLKDYLK